MKTKLNDLIRELKELNDAELTSLAQTVFDELRARPSTNAVNFDYAAQQKAVERFISEQAKAVEAANEVVESFMLQRGFPVVFAGFKLPEIPNPSNNQKGRRPSIPGTYRPKVEDVQAHLSEMFTPEELAKASKADIKKIATKPGEKTITEVIDEEREDRL